jgi:hypothetical protein
MSGLARLAAVVLGITLACTGDVPAAQPWTTAPHPDLGKPYLGDRSCFWLSLKGLPDYAVCWPSPAAHRPAGSPAGTTVLASFHSDSLACAGDRSGLRHHYLCVSIGGNPLTVAVTLSASCAASGTATGSLDLSAARLDLFRIVSLRI